MTWQTLKIPNTQSATGILYVAVILTFLGELVSHLLSQELRIPYDGLMNVTFSCLQCEQTSQAEIAPGVRANRVCSVWH